MSILLNFAIGFFGSLVGVIPPGLLNMSAAKISMKRGRKVALLFSMGVVVTVCVQTFISLILARYLDKHDEIVDMLQKVAVGIFFCITIYFFFIAKDTRREITASMNHSNINRFFYGMLLAALNLLPLPYWVYLSVTLSAFGWFSFEQPGIWAAMIGSGGGTFLMLAIYSQFFRKKRSKNKLKVNMNYVIGSITATITIITVVKILRNM